MPEISYTASQTEQIDNLRSYVEDYCQTRGIDPAIYTSALEDGTAGIDPALLNDPIFQAYWQLAYLQLMEVINPTLVQSLYAEVGVGGEVNFDMIYNATDPETREFIRKLVLDSPELMAFAALSDYDSETNPQAVLEALASEIPPAGEGGAGVEGDPNTFVNEDARALAEEFGLTGSWEWLIGTEEGIRSTESFLMEGLNQLDSQLLALQGQFESGNMPAESFQAQVGQISTYREVYVGLLQQLESALSQVMEMMSQLVKQRTDMGMALSRNIGGGA